MKRDVIFVLPDDILATTARIMSDRAVGFTPVCELCGRAVGAVTDRDQVVRGLARGLTARAAVREVMTREVVACTPQDELSRAEELMAERHTARVMVVDLAGRVVGVISLADVAQRESAAASASLLDRVSSRRASRRTKTPPLLRCQDVMKRDLVLARPDQSIVEVAEVMRARDVGFLPVCGSDGRVRGVVTDRDLVVRALALGRAPDTEVSAVMSGEVVTCGPLEDLASAAELMAKHRKSRLLVCDGREHVLGVISLSDVAAQHPAAAGRALRRVASREAR